MAGKEIYLRDYKKPNFLIEHVDLTFALNDETEVSSHLTLYPNPKSQEEVSDLILDGVDLKLLSITMNGQVLTPEQYEVTDTTLTIKNVPKEKFELDIKNIIRPKENTGLSGLYASNNNFTTQCEPEGFRHITYFLDRPDVMATYTTNIIYDAERFPIAISNGNLLGKGQLEDGRHWIKWNDPFKKPSYLFALVAGDLDCVEENIKTGTFGKELTLQAYIDKGYANQLQAALNALKKGIEWDEKEYGRVCDLDVYKIAGMMDFNMGAMENKGLNIFNAKRILFLPDRVTDTNLELLEMTMVHEYFHNWTGNRITLRDWFQLSLKEGLTTFREQSCIDETSSVATRINQINKYLVGMQFKEDAGPLAHSVQPESYIDIDNFYTVTVYEKGAEIYRMIQNTIGKELFRKGMDLYFERHDGQAVTIDDYIKAISDGSANDLSHFLLWYHQSGTPHVDVTDEYDADNQIYTLKMKQKTHPTKNQATKKALPIPIKMGLIDTDGHSILLQEEGHVKFETTLLLNQDEQEFKFYHIPKKPVPSLLRGFSAPVILNYDYKNADLSLLAANDTDLFNCWDAAQRYFTNIILMLINEYQTTGEVHISEEFFNTFQMLLQRDLEDTRVHAMLLTLPLVNTLCMKMDPIDIDAICHVRQTLVKSLGVRFKDEFKNRYQTLIDDPASLKSDAKGMGNRALQNLYLQYLVYSNEPELIELASKQFDRDFHINMTNAYAAMNVVNELEYPKRQHMLDQFYEKWHADPNTMDMWFETQANIVNEHTIKNIKALMEQPIFDIKNPNKVRALIGFFIRNHTLFHSKDGAGYELLADVVIKLNTINPHMAAQFAGAFADWKKFDKSRQLLMYQQLQRILAHPGLAKNVDEIITKTINDDQPLLALEFQRESLRVLEGTTSLHQKAMALFQWYTGKQVLNFLNPNREHPLLGSLRMYEENFSKELFHDWLSYNEGFLDLMQRLPFLPLIVKMMDDLFDEQHKVELQQGLKLTG